MCEPSLIPHRDEPHAAREHSQAERKAGQGLQGGGPSRIAGDSMDVGLSLQKAVEQGGWVDGGQTTDEEVEGSQVRPAEAHFKDLLLGVRRCRFKEFPATSPHRWT